MNIYSYNTQGKLGYLITVLKDEGIHTFFEKVFHGIQIRVVFFVNSKYQENRKKTFRFNGKELTYNRSKIYNNTWISERSIEISIGKYYLNRYKGKRIIEVGAVMNHYYKKKWDILDKFEEGKEIINEDAVTFVPPRKYDLVLCISTLEHIGFDDDKKEYKKTLLAVKNMKKNFLKKHGELVVTVPIGYNPFLDTYIKDDAFGFDTIIFMKRVNIFNEWVEVSKAVGLKGKYCWPYNNGNVVMVGIYKND